MTLSESILATLKYSDHFDFPLTLEEIHARLIQQRSTHARLSAELKNLIANQKVNKQGQYFFLPGRSSLVARRARREKMTAIQRSRANLLAAKLSGIPGVLSVFLTGSLAMNNAGSDADIDLMIMTQPGKLWTTRLLVTLYTELSGIRRHPGKKPGAGKLCLNLYLTPESCALPKNKRNLYTAYELIQAIPLAGSKEMQTELLAANPWIHKFLPNYRFSKKSSRKTSPIRSRKTLLEVVVYRLQRAYMQGKMTREYITPDAAFFHPKNPGKAVLQKISR